MRPVERIDQILEEIRIIWKQYPDLRLGQLITNVVKDPYLYYIEDETLIKTLKECYNQIKNTVESKDGNN